MALAAGDLVYSVVNSGLLSQSPLFGQVDYVNGDPPDPVRVCWFNGATQFFSSTDESESKLVVFTDGALPTRNPSFSYGIMRVMVTAGGTKHLVRHSGGFYEIKNA
jgi:hypothetical protein